jgi:hypothetical protein
MVEEKQTHGFTQVLGRKKLPPKNPIRMEVERNSIETSLIPGKKRSRILTNQRIRTKKKERRNKPQIQF